METQPFLTSRTRRRRRIVATAAIPIVAACIVGWLESGNWVVLYNDTPEILGEIQVLSGQDHHTVRDLEPRESRRVRVQAREVTDVTVQVADWAPEPPFRLTCDWRDTTTTTLRLDSSRTVTSTTERGLLNRLLHW
jgi:hypothetical protein